jgi:hypothetical protein
VGTPRTKYKVRAHWSASTPYKPLADSGPLGSLEAPVEIDAEIEPDYPPDMEGKPRLGGARLKLVLIDGIYRLMHYEAYAPDDSWLDPEEVRSTRFADDEIQAALATAVRLVTRDGDVFTSERPIDNPDPHWQIALEYASARAIGRPPLAAITEHLRISRAAAAQRVKRAREKGFLPPTERGKVS